jgi:CubicO group peptidase (beta-lactamase class C family)
MMERPELTETLNTSIEEHAFPGVISIHQQDTLLYERAASSADRSNQIENTLATGFGIASGTKLFTAFDQQTH